MFLLRTISPEIKCAKSILEISKVATRTTSREINRRIVLNVIREHQPISRADLARHLNITRGVVSTLVQELIGAGRHLRRRNGRGCSWAKANVSAY